MVVVSVRPNVAGGWLGSHCRPLSGTVAGASGFPRSWEEANSIIGWKRARKSK